MNGTPEPFRETESSLDEVDQKIVAHLRQDGRASFSDLARTIGLSGEAIRIRFEKLERSGVLRIVGSVSPAVVGYTTFALVAIEAWAPLTEVADAITDLPATDFVVATSGTFDLLAEVACRDEKELLATLDEIRSIPGARIAQTFLYLSFNKYSYGSNDGLGGTLRWRADASNEPISLDEADHAIIQSLREDGRRSYADLAETSGLTYPSTRRRFLRLLEHSIVHIHTIVNPLVSEQKVQAGVALRVAGDLSQAVSDLQALPEIDVAITITGAYDLILEVTCRSRADLADFLGTRLKSIDSIEVAYTYAYLDIYKLPYTWSGVA